MKNSSRFWMSLYIHFRIAALGALLVLMALHASGSKAECQTQKARAQEIFVSAGIAAPVDAHVVGQWRGDFALRGETYLTIAENHGEYYVNILNHRHGVNITEKVAVCPVAGGQWRFAVAADFLGKGPEVVEIRGSDARLTQVRVMDLKLKGDYTRVNGRNANLYEPDLPEYALDQVEAALRNL